MAEPIKFVDLPAQHADVQQAILQDLAELMSKAGFVGGPVLEAFEAKLAAYCGTEHAVSCSDGTMALVLALLGMSIGKGDGVVVPTNSFIATANAVVHAGGTPVLVDCDPETFLIDLNQTEDILKAGQARFIAPVHLYGNPCPMREVMALAERYGAQILEDNAQAIGATVDGQRTGSFGQAGAISFYPAKNLGAFGQGGAIVTHDANVAHLARVYREQGTGAQRYQHDVIGYNARLDSFQAVILSRMLDKLDGFNAARQRVAAAYTARLPKDRLQKRTPNSVPVYHLMEYRCDSAAHRDKLADALKAADIGFGFHYPIPIHKQKAYPEANAMSLSVAERLAETLISLPIHPFMADKQVERVCQVVGSV